MYLKSYKELIVWQKAIDLVEEVYILTNQFPKEEIYGLSMQMRRAAVSISSNIADGQRRKYLPEFLQFLRIGDTSSAELETQIIISKRLYSELDYSKVEKLLEEVKKMLSAMIDKLKLKAESSRLLTPERSDGGQAKLKAQMGFTLIELLIAITIFSLAVLLAASGFVRALRSERQASLFFSVNSNLSLVLEQMAREIRTGTNFCANGISCGSSNVLSFINAKSETVTYCFDGKAIERFVGSGSCGNGPKITANNIEVKYLTFIISGNQNNDGYPPRITILTGASPQNVSAASYLINFQTTVSSRILDG